MKRYFVFVLLAISALFGCEDPASYPNESGINLTVDWSEVTTDVPTIYRARAIFSSGFTRDFDELKGTTNLLVVNPGEVMLYVYNNAEHISVSGNKARVNTENGSIAPNPGLFFSYYTQVFSEQDKDISQTAVMKQQTGEIKISLALKPANQISKVKTISAVLEGVASELDMQTNKLSESATLQTTLSKNTYYATTTIRVLGFDQATRQNLTLEVELENGNKTSITSDLTTLVADFNNSKNTLLALNANLNISNEQSVTLDKWEKNTEVRYLSVFPLEIDFNNLVSSESIHVFTDRESWEYSIVQGSNWLTATKSTDRLDISVTANTSAQARQATIQISAGGLTENITIAQSGYVTGPYADKEIIKIQSATVGKGVNIILMGDGYTTKDMNRGTGKYEQDMRMAANHFFSIYPYTEYRDYFNVYMVVAISNQEGVSIESPRKNVDTKFKTLWEGGNSTGLECDDDIVIDYVYSIRDLINTHINDLTVIMPINANIYAGTCYMALYTDNRLCDFGNGFSIGMCPTGAYYKEVVTHEIGGHGFSKVFDEYVYNPNERIPNLEKNRIIEFKEYGWGENVDFYSDILQTTWKGFANLPKYNMVSTFEGAYVYGKGIWRPEYNSCMANNVQYYNAPTRWAIVRRIMQLAGFNYSFSQFLQDDRVPAYPTTTRSDSKHFMPLAPPIIKDMRENRPTR